jgi:cysteinyl-tRNA synthetase
MTTRLCLQNTLSGRKEIFRPRNPEGPVRIFTCGPSIYDRPHVGNYRTFLFEDVLERYLEYLGHPVQRLINFTDVEDKAIAEARRQGVALEDLTGPAAERFFEDCRLLRIRLPETVSRSSTSVDQAVHLIRRLLDKGIAYWHGKDVFYDPLRFKGFGKLYGLDMSRWPKKRIRFHKDTYPGHRWNRGDFILWKGRRKKDDTIYWDTELGQGRPSWNVQDPAMITRHLGYQVDISCGGIDNLYRHHDYNIAVIEGVSGKTFANYWLHGAHVLVDGVKMAKSRGNITYPSDLLERGFAPHHLRFYLIYGHYREKRNLEEERLQLCRGKVDTLLQNAARITEEDGSVRKSDGKADGWIRRLRTGFEEGMNDDLDVEGAFEAVYDALQKLAVVKARGRLSAQDSRRAGEALRGIESVWRIGLTEGRP